MISWATCAWRVQIYTFLDKWNLNEKFQTHPFHNRTPQLWMSQDSGRTTKQPMEEYKTYAVLEHKAIHGKINARHSSHTVHTYWSNVCSHNKTCFSPEWAPMQLCNQCLMSVCVSYFTLCRVSSKPHEFSVWFSRSERGKNGDGGHLAMVWGDEKQKRWLEQRVPRIIPFLL